VKRIYINGVLDATATGDTNFLTDSSALELGISYYNGGIAGVVDDVQFYDGLLTAADVASLHANPGSTIPDILFLSLGSGLGDTNLAWTPLATLFGLGKIMCPMTAMAPPKAAAWVTTNPASCKPPSPAGHPELLVANLVRE